VFFLQAVADNRISRIVYVLTYFWKDCNTDFHCRC